MKEAFEKIKERLERERDIHKNAYDVAILALERTGYASYARACDEAISIVNQVAEEYDNDFCEWKSDFNWFSGKCKHETSCGYTFYDLKHAEPFKVCPYCGKKIKVVE